MRTIIYTLLFCVICTVFPKPALSQFYKWKDKDGNLIISTTPPPPGVDAERREIRGEPTPSTTDSEQEPANPAIRQSSGESGESPMPRSTQPLIDSIKERMSYRKSITALFEAGSMAVLEERVAELRRTRPRFSSGMPVLFDFYSAFDPESDHIPTPTKADYANRLMKWADANPTSYIAQMAKIRIHVNRAWKARGNGAAATVTEAGWKIYNEQLLKAWSTAEAVERRGEVDAALYDQMILLCKGLGKSRSEVDAVFAKMTAIDPTFDQGYVEMAMYLLPRWNGSPSELHEFAMNTIQLTNEPVMYARIAIIVALYEHAQGFLADYPFQYKILKKAFELLNRRYPDSAVIVNFAAWFAICYRDTAAAVPLVRRISQEWTSDADEIWGGKQQFEMAKQRLTH